MMGFIASCCCSCWLELIDGGVGFAVDAVVVARAAAMTKPDGKEGDGKQKSAATENNTTAGHRLKYANRRHGGRSWRHRGQWRCGFCGGCSSQAASPIVLGVDLLQRH